MVSQITKEYADRVLETRTTMLELTRLQKEDTDRRNGKPAKRSKAIRPQTLAYVEAQYRRHGHYDWHKNPNGYYVGRDISKMKEDVRTMLREAAVEIPFKDYAEFIEPLTMSDKRVFLREVIDKLGPSLLTQNREVAEVFFSVPEPNDGSFDSNHIRGVFVSFKTKDPEQARENSEILRRMLRMRLYEKCELGSSKSFVGCAQYIDMPVDEFYDFYHQMMDVVAGLRGRSRHARFHRRDDVAELAERLKQSYLKSIFVSEDDKKKFLLLM